MRHPGQLVGEFRRHRAIVLHGTVSTVRQPIHMDFMCIGVKEAFV